MSSLVSINTMRIISKDKIKEVVDLIVSKARYQKVLICCDDSSDKSVIDKIMGGVGNRSVVIKLNFDNSQLEDFEHMVNDGVRIIVYNVKIDNYYKIASNSEYILNVFIPTSSFVLPYMMHAESLYGENMMLCDVKGKDLLGVMVLYDAGLNYIWGMVQQHKKVSLEMFKKLDNLINDNDNFYINYLECCLNLKPYVSTELVNIDSEKLHMYILIKLCVEFKMLIRLNEGTEGYIDFYKTAKSEDEISKAYQLIVKSELIDLLRLNNNNIIRVVDAIINRCKILIKKYFNYKNIKINKINNKLKNQAKELKIDNLLYISYIFNAI